MEYDDSLDEALQRLDDTLFDAVSAARESGLAREEVLAAFARGLYLLATTDTPEPSPEHVRVVSVAAMTSCACHLRIEVGERPRDIYDEEVLHVTH